MRQKTVTSITVCQTRKTRTNISPAIFSKCAETDLNYTHRQNKKQNNNNNNKNNNNKNEKKKKNEKKNLIKKKKKKKKINK